MSDFNSQSRPKHILMMAAGTGGHVFPALAVAKELQKRGHKVSWLATPTGMENRLLKDENFTIFQIDIQGIRGNGIVRKLQAPFKILKATLAAIKIIKTQQIEAVVSFGGYVAGPGGLAARAVGIPVLVHEQNAIAGFTNTQLARIAKIVCQAFPNTFPNSAYIKTTGNPVREQICQTLSPSWRYAEREKQDLPLQVLVVGGSLGAKALNETVPEALVKLNVPLNVRHQCGQQLLENTQKQYEHVVCSENFKYEVLPFIDDMAKAYSEADLIICRAGALTVTEIATAGVAAVFIPLPSAVDDHQTANANYLVGVGAAKICPQKEMTAEHLCHLLQPMMDRTVLSEMAEQARQHAQPNATSQVADFIEGL